MDDSGRRPRRAGDPAADALRLRQPRPRRRAARSGGSPAQPLSGRRRGGAWRARRAWAEDRGHRRQRLFLGRAGDHDGRFDRAPRRPRLPGPRRCRMGRDCDAGDDRGAPLARWRRGALSSAGGALCGSVRGPGGAGRGRARRPWGGAPTGCTGTPRRRSAMSRRALASRAATSRSICRLAAPGRLGPRTSIGCAGPWC